MLQDPKWRRNRFNVKFYNTSSFWSRLYKKSMIWMNGREEGHSMLMKSYMKRQVWCQEHTVWSGSGEEVFVVKVNVAGEGEEQSRKRWDKRKIIDLRGSSFELLSQWPSCIGLEETVSGCCGMPSTHLMQDEGPLTAPSTRRPDIWGSQLVSFQDCPSWASSYPAPGYWGERNTCPLALIWDNADRPLQLQSSP